MYSIQLPLSNRLKQTGNHTMIKHDQKLFSIHSVRFIYGNIFFDDIFQQNKSVGRNRAFLIHCIYSRWQALQSF